MMSRSCFLSLMWIGKERREEGEERRGEKEKVCGFIFRNQEREERTKKKKAKLWIAGVWSQHEGLETLSSQDLLLFEACVLFISLPLRKSRNAPATTSIGRSSCLVHAGRLIATEEERHRVTVLLLRTWNGERFEQINLVSEELPVRAARGPTWRWDEIWGRKKCW